jgi:uncharacterized protein YndB with AHSA1/START domain
VNADPQPPAAPVDLSAMTVEVTHRFAADIGRVWALLSDFERMAGLGPEHLAARVDGDAGGREGPAVGTTFTGRNRIGDREWEVPCHVVAVEAPTHLAWTVLDPAEPSSTWTYDLSPDGDGTVVVQRFRHGPGFSYLRASVERHPERAEDIVRGRAEMLRSNMEATLRAAGRLLGDEP